MFGDDNLIAHVILHELVHSGAYTDGVPVMDESATDVLTRKGLMELGWTPVSNGYDNVVGELMPFMNLLSWAEMAELIQANPIDTINNLMEFVVLLPALTMNDLTELSWQRIEQKVNGGWALLQRLFPRIMNEVTGHGYGVHDPTDLTVSEFGMENVLQHVAWTTFQSGALRKMLTDVLSIEGLLTIVEARQILINLGLQYMLDFLGEELDKLIDEILGQKHTKLQTQFDARWQMDLNLN